MFFGAVGFNSAFKIPAVDSRILNRMVGFVEYGQALTNLELFIASATPEELELAEQIVGERDDLAVFTNVSRRVEKEPSALSERAEGPADTFERRGLGWLMALARVELGTLIAGFDDHKTPMTASRPTQFELDEYREMVEDSLRTHYWALRADPIVKVIQQRRGRTQRLPLDETVLIAYYRRVWIALQLARTASLLDASGAGSPRQTLLQQWQLQLDGLEKVVLRDMVLNNDALKLAESYMPYCAQRLLERDLRMQLERMGAVDGPPPFPTN
jgi:hypothetical protein